MCFYTKSNKKPSCRWDSRPYCLTADYHCCKGDERFQWEMPFFRVFQLRNPWTDFQKILHSWLLRWPHPTRKYLDQSAQRGCVCACVKLVHSSPVLLQSSVHWHLPEAIHECAAAIVIVRHLFFLFFSFMLIATGLPVGPIIAFNGVFWCHSHS